MNFTQEARDLLGHFDNAEKVKDTVRLFGFDIDALKQEKGMVLSFGGYTSCGTACTSFGNYQSEPFERRHLRILEESCDDVARVPLLDLADDGNSEVGLRGEVVVEAPLLNARVGADLADSDIGVAAAKPEREGALDDAFACGARSSHS